MNSMNDEDLERLGELTMSVLLEQDVRPAEPLFGNTTRRRESSTKFQFRGGEMKGQKMA